MTDALFQLSLFTAKSLILVVLILFFLTMVIVILSRGKEKLKGRITIKNLSKKFSETKEELLGEILDKKAFKKFMKDKKALLKKQSQSQRAQKNVFVLNFHGDMKASAVAALREEINAIINIAQCCDEVVMRLESPGGVVNGYGLAAAQLMRLREKNIPLTITVDKVAASGGYMMACIANKILCSPYAIIGSIGVIVQLPNFHQWLKDKHIAFEQVMAGEYKRTLSLFGENTDEGREKLKEEIEDVHQLFKALIAEHRPQLDIQRVATGEYWLGKQALELSLVDAIQTSDGYLEARAAEANLYEISYQTKKTLANKFTQATQKLHEKFFANTLY